ncbi:cytochrome C oxidase subunit IV family protein [Rubrivivax gelatinosus]|uniref:Cytochrome c oxidase subunit IV n=1 Tax=Rubrivivax gelatinosus TaxID=28068 RepID=A0A4R2M064_RUBGE|nr:cytochrome C oxidase subunit IV family protein [Rubrivivax gelatinosus]MBK1687995.1 hypothetical protein [Rubrivivax gelatinosus]TCO99279.1 cytochrome c oxidase subunit IV [Rubrivivax gelatinosus]
MSRIDLVWAGLVVATLLSFAVGESASAGGGAAWPVWLVFALALAKGAAVALDFMGLATAPALWRRLVLGWLGSVVALVLLAWWLARA